MNIVRKIGIVVASTALSFGMISAVAAPDAHARDTSWGYRMPPPPPIIDDVTGN